MAFVNRETKAKINATPTRRRKMYGVQYNEKITAPIENVKRPGKHRCSASSSFKLSCLKRA
jgi:hypothetical protein